MKKKDDLDFVSLGASAGGLSAGASVVVVVSPHPDDDVIGMGGTMRRYADAGAAVYSVYLTDGGTGPGGTRSREALAALKVVRASGAFFLHHESAALAGAGAGKAARQLRHILDRVQPAELYLPSPLERHPTHRRATRITYRTLQGLPRQRMRVWGYSVWGGAYGLPGSKAVDITAYMKIKQKAIRQHASQTAIKPYDRGILGRNAYEGIFLHTHDGRYAEGAEIFIPLAPPSERRAERG